MFRWNQRVNRENCPSLMKCFPLWQTSSFTVHSTSYFQTLSSCNALCFFPSCRSAFSTLLLSCSLLRIFVNLDSIFPRVTAEMSASRLRSVIQKCLRSLHLSASRRKPTNPVNLSASCSLFHSVVVWLYHSSAVLTWKEDRGEKVGSRLRTVLVILNRSWRHPWSLSMSFRSDFCISVYDLTHAVSLSVPAESKIWELFFSFGILRLFYQLSHELVMEGSVYWGCWNVYDKLLL